MRVRLLLFCVLSVNASFDLPPHPRLRVLPTDLERIKHNVATLPTATAYAEHLALYGQSLINTPVVNCSKAGVEHSELSAARAVLDRTYTLGLLWRLDQNASWAERAIKEMVHVSTDSECPDWNPPHFLDTAEMMHAVAVGYDWLYDAPLTLFTTEQRATIERGIALKGLGAAATNWQNSEFTTQYNWNLVCNGGMIAASIALMDSTNVEYATLAAAVHKNATARIHIAMQSYAPDGGWPEGPTYWGYASKYSLVAIEMLLSAQGSSNGMTTAPGFSKTGLFRIYDSSPSNQKFNWGDSDASGDDEFASNFFGLSKFADSDLVDLFAWYGRNLVGEPSPHTCTTATCALSLIDYSDSGSGGLLQALPTCKSFALSDSGWNNQTALGYFRSSWTGVDVDVDGGVDVDVDADVNTNKNTNTSTNTNTNTPTNTTRNSNILTNTNTDTDTNTNTFNTNTRSAANESAQVWLAFKGGNPQANHNDADAGAFVLEMGGRRWAVDLGADSYGLSGYWDKSPASGERYSYYRKSTRGHNTLTFNGVDQQPGWSSQNANAISPISSFSCNDPSGPSAVVDLTPSYKTQGGPHPPMPPLTRVQRGFAAVQSFGLVVVVDEWEAGGAKNVTWAMHVENTNITIHAATPTIATLTQGTDTLVVKILEPVDGTAVFTSATPVIEPPQDPVGPLTKLMVVADPTKVQRLVVAFTLPSYKQTPPTFNPLKLWPTQGAVKR